MDRSNVIYLVSQNSFQDSLGIWRTQPTKRKVFCNVSSVSQTEWFEGGRNGLNPEYRMTMFAPDYQGENVLEYNGEEFAIYRTFRGKNDNIELYVEKRKGAENGKD